MVFLLLLALVAQADGGQELTDEMMDEALASNKDYVRLAVSGLICHADIVRMVGLKQIADEKEASKIGGVVNMKTLHDAQTAVFKARKLTAYYRDVLKSRHLKAMECKGDVTVLLKCWADSDAEEGCDSQGMKALIRLMESFVPD
jgi:hypothetical protein